MIISTHAPLAGRDIIFHPHPKGHGISTHAPLAGRDDSDLASGSIGILFQPTRPLRGATNPHMFETPFL